MSDHTSENGETKWEDRLNHEEGETRKTLFNTLDEDLWKGQYRNGLLRHDMICFWKKMAAVAAVILMASMNQPHSYSSGRGFYLEVPYVRQVKNYCGPAALASVFRYWDRPADQHDLASRFKPFPGKGLSGIISPCFF